MPPSCRECVQLMRWKFSKWNRSLDIMTSLECLLVQIMYLIKDEAEKTAKKKEFAEQTCPKMFEYMQSLVSGKFVLGDKASVADIALFSIVHDYLVIIKDEFDVSKYPKIQSVIENFKPIPNVAEFIAKYC
uniref:AlNc14C13G1566 protein n=1 Tax=Albugo laibachii Nc14 TaxID=890382 RepID=F0W3K4_9STRA|nr:AlNc14C13G1566 [Albugo laibachii Nc14]CCA16290.1 AlNc14C20G2065 [Albugo laibachii Nc14]|eukprot:CCA16290.1 AlNc14C20G2065 [Albugo laibachii Nc14]